MDWITMAQQQLDIAFKENYVIEDDTLDVAQQVWENYDEFCDTVFKEFQIFE